MSKTSTVKGQRLSGRGVVKKIFQIREIVILLLVLVLAVFMALMFIYVIVLILAVNGIKQFLKRKKVSRGGNLTITLLVDVLLAFSMVALIIHAVLQLPGNGQQSEHISTYEHLGITYQLRQDKLKLMCHHDSIDDMEESISCCLDLARMGQSDNLICELNRLKQILEHMESVENADIYEML